MADVLPINFPIPNESIISSYSYTDVAEGTGVQQFYMVKVSVDDNLGNDVYRFTTNPGLFCNPLSDEGAEEGDSEYTIVTSSTDIDVDVTFNLPKTIEGDMFVVIPLRVNSGTNGAIDIIITTKKWDGSTESTIVAATTAPTFAVPSGNDRYGCRTLKIPVPLTNFKAGETLRITITASQAGTSSTRYLYHSPSASSSNHTVTGGRFSLYVPFKLNL